MFKEFLFNIGAVKPINRMVKTNDTAWFCIHKDNTNLMQAIYQIISFFFEDDCADKLTNGPVMTANCPAEREVWHGPEEMFSCQLTLRTYVSNIVFPDGLINCKVPRRAHREL